MLASHGEHWWTSTEMENDSGTTAVGFRREKRTTVVGRVLQTDNESGWRFVSDGEQ